MSLSQIIEVLATVLGLIFVTGAILRKVWCWLPGILSSALIIYNLVTAGLYAEIMLQIFYIIMGFYGWYSWIVAAQKSMSKGVQTHLPVRALLLSTHLLLLLGGTGLALGLAWLLRAWTDAQRSVVDSLTSVFGIIATWLEARMMIGAWLYWIVINIVSTWLYYDRNLKIYAMLYVIYLIASVVGYAEWKKIRLSQLTCT